LLEDGAGQTPGRGSGGIEAGSGEGFIISRLKLGVWVDGSGCR